MEQYLKQTMYTGPPYTFHNSLKKYCMLLTNLNTWVDEITLQC
jgi:hypothetical protein